MTTSSIGISLGLITAELVINALKHAFPEGRSGTIVVSYKATEDEWRLKVSDDGVGISISPTRKEGLGSTIVQSLARQLGGAVDIKTSPKGTTVSISGTLKTQNTPKTVSATHS